MGCGESKHDVATGNIISKIKKPSFRSVSSSKSKKAPETATNNVAAAADKQGESLVEKKSDVKGKEETAQEKTENKAVAAMEDTQRISPAKETEQKFENAKPVVVSVEETPQAVKEDAAVVIAEEKTLLQAVKENPAAVIVEEKKPVEEKPLLQETQAVKENAAAAVIIAEEKKPVEEKPLLQETKVEKEKEVPVVVQEEKLVVIKEEGVTTKVEVEKATKEDNLAIKKEVQEAAQLVEEKATKEDNLAIKKEVQEVAKSVSLDEPKPLTETGKEEKPIIEKETKADSAAASGLNISTEMK